MLVLEPLKILYNDCNLYLTRQSTQKCFTNVSLFKHILSDIEEFSPDLADFGIDRNGVSGKGCSCFYDVCNNIEFGKRVGFPFNVSKVVLLLPLLSLPLLPLGGIMTETRVGEHLVAILPQMIKTKMCGFSISAYY